jgi:hypothetical protein
MKYASTAQIQKINIMMHQVGYNVDTKRDAIHQVTHGRTSSTSGLFADEARDIIKGLCEYVVEEKIKSAIVSLAYRAGIIYGTTPEDKRINMAKLNLFIRERGAVKKPLNELDYKELVKVQRQFEAMLRNIEAAKAKKAQKEHDKQVADLLSELNLQTA